MIYRKSAPISLATLSTSPTEVEELNQLKAWKQEGEKEKETFVLCSHRHPVFFIVVPFIPLSKLRWCSCSIGNGFFSLFFPVGTPFQKLATRRTPTSFPGFSPNRPFRSLCDRETGSGPESGDYK